MYAIIDDGGRQHKVTTGDVIRIDREATEDKTITFDRVLLVGGEGEAKIGSPHVAGATVVGDVLGAIKGKKIDTIKYRREGVSQKDRSPPDATPHQDQRNQHLRFRIKIIFIGYIARADGASLTRI